MKRTTCTLALVALTTLVSCSNQIGPASPPADEPVAMVIYTTHATSPLINTVNGVYGGGQAPPALKTDSGNYDAMMDSLGNGDTSYFVSQHLTPEDSAVLWAAPLAQDGLAVVNHPDNPVNDLTAEQLRRIFSGFITNWNEVGGVDAEIALISRESGSATRLEFDRLVMGLQRTSPNAEVVSSSDAVIQRVRENPHAIGYVMHVQMREGVKAVAVDGVVPSFASITNNTYPLRSILYIVGHQEPEAAYRALIAWVQSPQGQIALQPDFAPLPK